LHNSITSNIDASESGCTASSEDADMFDEDGVMLDEYRTKEITLLYEYNGHHHYCINSVVEAERDSSITEWVQIDSNHWLISIPYWIQPTCVHSFNWFGVAKDYSNEFPHGFISSKCVLPERFCRAGEERFITELDSLDADTKQQVINSIKAKTESKNLMKVASRWMWYELLKRDTITDNEVKILVQKCKSAEKCYKDLTPKEFNELEENRFVKFSFSSNEHYYYAQKEIPN